MISAPCVPVCMHFSGAGGQKRIPLNSNSALGTVVGMLYLMVVITTEHSFLPSPESKPPPASLVAACMGALERSRDARFLVPALAGLSRQEAFLHLPKLLSLKDPAGFTAGMQRLLLPQPATGALAHVQTTLMNTTVHYLYYCYCHYY